MGRQVAAEYGESKQQMTVSTVAAGALAGAAAEIRLFVGDNALPRMTEAKNRAIKCLNAFIENDAVDPTQFGTYHCGIDESVATVVTDGVVATVTESDVALVVGGSFTAAGDGSSQLVDGIFRQAVDLLLEDRKNA